ncbi:MAG: hypothetical protein II388_05030, partial [Clostridia bacterium]|nr:hypothetical protein [Clostridia bacterium]
FLDVLVPTSRKINNKALSSDVTLSASDVNAVPTADLGVAGGVATLDANGKVNSSQLPSSVDDIIEAPTASQFPAQGESNKIYVALDTNLTYRWGGTAYVEISPSLALGNTHSTAFYGDFGEAAYNHSLLVGAQGQTRNPHNVTLADLGYGEATSQEIAAIFS